MKKNLAIIGGGIVGALPSGALKGHDVTLYEDGFPVKRPRQQLRHYLSLVHFTP